jgi:hypothetical protein
MDEKKTVLITWALLAVSIVLIVFGVLQGEASAVLNKAVKVCMQCIGIG